MEKEKEFEKEENKKKEQAIEGLCVLEASEAKCDADKKSPVKEAENKEDSEMKDEEKKERSYEENLHDSMTLLAGYRLGSNMSEEELEEALNLLKEIGREVGKGKITIEMLRMSINALRYDTAVSEARKEGELRGRNARISELMPASVESKNQDTTPRMPSSGAAGAGRKRPSIFSLAGEAR